MASISRLANSSTDKMLRSKTWAHRHPMASAIHSPGYQATRLTSITSHPPTALEKSWNTGKILGNLFLTFESFESFERQKSKAAHGQPLEGLPFPAQHCSELAAWKMLRCELHGCPMVSAIYAIYIHLCHLCKSICSFSPTKDLRKS